MQPLTPSERRYVENTKGMLIKGHNYIAGVSYLDNKGNLVLEINSDEDKDLWLKVLSMALETNEAIEQEWRKR